MSGLRFTELPIVLIYNNKLVDAASAPRGFEDLFDGNWDGKVSFADPEDPAAAARCWRR